MNAGRTASSKRVEAFRNRTGAGLEPLTDPVIVGGDGKAHGNPGELRKEVEILHHQGCPGQDDGREVAEGNMIIKF